MQLIKDIALTIIQTHKNKLANFKECTKFFQVNVLIKITFALLTIKHWTLKITF